MIDAKRLGERLRMIRKHLGIKQQQLAKATYLTQPTISRLENGEEVYASVLLAVLAFYRDKVSLDHLFDPNLDTSDQSPLYDSNHEAHQKLDSQLVDIAKILNKGLEQIKALRTQI